MLLVCSFVVRLIKSGVRACSPATEKREYGFPKRKSYKRLAQFHFGQSITDDSR